MNYLGIIDELVNRSMIQPMETGYYGEILCCKVHDMILDLIRLKSEEDNFMRVVENSQGMSTALQSKVRRLALHFEENQETEEIVASLSMSHIRSLTVFGKSSFKLPISELKFIRVLNLVVEDNGIDLTPIRQLFQLTYLDVGNAQLPTRIRDLQRLETLKCTSDIPSDVIDLPCLLHLHIRGGRLPDGICKMKSLRTLHSFDIGNNSDDNLRGLGELKNIRGLTITCHNGGTFDGILKGLNQRGIFDVFWSSIGKLVNYNLRSLGLFVDFLSTKAIAGCSSFTCHTESNLEIFDCREWMFPRVPSWISQHHKLSMLDLQIMKLTQDGIDLLAGLPNLTNLLMWIRKSPEESIVIRGGVAAFPVLANFRIWCFAPCFTFQEGAMPSVQNLELRFHLHAMMRRQFPVNGVEHLVRLRKVQARIHFGDADTELGSWVTGAETTLRNAISAHPRQPSITVDVKGDKPPYYGVCELLDDEDVNHADLGPKIHQMALEKLLKWKDRARSSVQPKA